MNNILMKKTCQSFVLACSAIEKQGRSTHKHLIPDAIPIHLDYMNSFVTNCAFAIELSIKILLNSEDKKIKSHNLYKLFINLSDKLKVSIISDIISRLHNGISENEFYQYLEEMSDYFTRSRYFYEDPHFTVRYFLMKYFMISISSKSLDGLMIVDSFFDGDI